MVSAMKVKFNRNFYTEPSFYIYFIVTFFWILDIPDASNVYEKSICIVFTVIGIFATIKILFKK